MIGKTPYEQLEDSYENLVLENTRINYSLAELKGQFQAELSESVVSLRIILKENEHNLDRLTKDLESERKIVRELRGLLASEKARLETSEKQVQLIRGSTSWRITAPVRAFVTRFKRPSASN